MTATRHASIVSSASRLGLAIIALPSMSPAVAAWGKAAVYGLPAVGAVLGG